MIFGSFRMFFFSHFFESLFYYINFVCYINLGLLFANLIFVCLNLICTCTVALVVLDLCLAQGNQI